MQSKASLICVDPAQVRHFWPYVEPLLRPAVENVGLSNFELIAADILSGKDLLWIVWSGKIEGAASTSWQVVGGEKICVLTAGGGNMRQCLPFLWKIEEYAKAEGCKAVRVFGREGWLRALEGYRKTAIVIEKELA